MGVHGLWRLIEPSGKPIPLETLENKTLAVDISIWLHQAIKGFQDAKGATIPNAHLLGIYHRVCKLLYFKIKPVFVFDGGVPALKRQTIDKRNQLKSRNCSEADRLQKQLLSTLLKHTAISKVLSEKTKASIAAQTKKLPKSKDDLYMLPSSSEMDSTLTSSDEEELENDSTDSSESSPSKRYDLHTIDTKSPYFQSLPLETRHEILTDLKETRKQNSWGRLHELPKKSDDFSCYQMNRLLKRQQVQAALDDAAKEMGGASLSLMELESLFQDQGIPTSNNVGQRIASDSDVRFLYIKDIKEALEHAKLEKEKKKEHNEPFDEQTEPKARADLEEEEDLQRAIALSLQEEPSTSDSMEVANSKEFSFLENFRDEDFESDVSQEDLEDVSASENFSSAHSYMMEYSGLTPSEISKILNQNARQKSKKMVRSKDIVLERCSTLEKGKSISGSFALEKIEESVEHVCDSSTENHNIFLNNLAEPVESLSKRNEQPQSAFAISGQDLIDEKKEDISTKTTHIDMTRITIENNITERESFKNEERETGTIENKIIVSDNKKTDHFEQISDTLSSSSDEFLVVEDLQEDFNEDKNMVKREQIIELTIDSEKIEKDYELFADVFEDKKDIEKLEEILNRGKIKNNEKTTTQFNKTGNIIQGKACSDVDRVVTIKNKRELKTMGRVTDNTQSSGETFVINKQRYSSEENIPIEKVPPVGAMEQTISSSVSIIEISKECELPSKTPPKLSISELQEMKDNLQKEKIDLLIEKSSKERLATNISDQMYQEAQELLELFGVPYIIAPMEAEAQCAFLDEIQLTDGTITDDSDIWLFGGRTVYKNFFNQAKYVMEFRAENITHHFKLNRQQMILLALLVGSDYTIGVRGVGPVTALEILSNFPPPSSSEFDLTQTQLISGLKEFKVWLSRGQSGGPGKSVLKNKLKNITFTENFPNVQVVQAYLEPKVETSKEKFSWSKPDFVALTLFAREKFGWSSKKTEEILNPVIKRIEETKIQKSIKEYFKTKFKLDCDDAGEKMSKRVKLAIERFGKSQEELIAEELELLEKEKQRKLKRNAPFLEEESEKKRSRKGESEKRESNGNTEVKTKKRTSRKESQDSVSSSSEHFAKTIKQEGESHQRIMRKSRSKISDSDDVTQPAKVTRGRKHSEGNEKPAKLGKKSSNLAKIALCQEAKVNHNEELKLYENVAAELRQRRQRKNELAKLKNESQKNRKKELVKKSDQRQPVEIPVELETDEEIQYLLATTSQSIQKVQAINEEFQVKLKENEQKRNIPYLHNKEVIHQKLRNQSDLLRNKLKAIEVFRKSKKGPGYVPKRERCKRAPKEDAGLSEESD